MHILSALAIAAALCGSACQPIGSAALSREDVAAIQAASRARVEAARGSDWEALSALYARDAVLLPPNQPPLQGRDAIREWYASQPPVRTIDFATVEIAGRGDLAYVHGTYRQSTGPADAEPVHDTGKYVSIHRRAEDGRWPITREISNSDLPARAQP